jgi:hypothetical protein
VANVETLEQPVPVVVLLLLLLLDGGEALSCFFLSLVLAFLSVTTKSRHRVYPQQQHHKC